MLNCSVWWFCVVGCFVNFVCYFSCVRLLVIWLVLMNCLPVICGVFGLDVCDGLFYMFCLLFIYLDSLLFVFVCFGFCLDGLVVFDFVGVVV